VRSHLPSLRAVEIFVVAGNALSFAAAAATMNLTPSAVSRRIRDLERDLGVPLFRRFNRRIELTLAGRRYLDAVSPAIEQIDRASEALRPRRQTVLRLSVLQSLASTWLLPRLAGLRQRRPDLDIRLETSPELADLSGDRFDAAIRFGDGCWPGLVADRLFETDCFPVAAPGLLAPGGLASAAVLDGMVLLDIAQAPDLWPQYLAGVGLEGYRPRRVQIFDNVQVLYEAAANGLGLALAARQLVDGQLAAGRLVAAFSNPPVRLRQSYYLVCRPDRRERSALRVLREALIFDCADVTRGDDNLVCAPGSGPVP
jgi:LysR family transcriptional regulator, glycine cleavage system transcriptional activator